MGLGVCVLLFGISFASLFCFLFLSFYVKYSSGKVISVEEAHRMKEKFKKIEPKQPFVRSSDNRPDERCWYVRYDDDGDAEEMSEGDLWAFAIPSLSQQPTVSDHPPAYYLLEETNNNQTTPNHRRKRKKQHTCNNELSVGVSPSPQKRKTPSLGRSRRNKSLQAKQSPLSPREPGAKYQYDEALRHLMRSTTSEEDIKWALQATEPPYDLNDLVHRIRIKNQDVVEQSPEFGEINPSTEPFEGMRVRKQFGNEMHYGTVMHIRTLGSEKL